MECPLCHQDMQVIPTTRGDKFPVHGDCPGGFSLVDLAETNLESRYTDPTVRCPHPERWHAEDWDSAELEVTKLVAAFVRALRPDLALETGTAFGQTAEAIGKVMAGVGVGHLWTCEPEPERAEIARKRCADLPVSVMQKESLDTTFHEDARFGFAWFDSLVPLRVPEFRHFYEWLAPGAIVGFHDTDNNGQLWPQIAGLEDEGLLLPIRLPTPRGVVFGEVVK